MVGMWCRFCKSEENTHEHHIIPKCIEGTDADGRIRLCKKCHDKLHFGIITLLYRYISEVDRIRLKDSIKIWTKNQVRYPYIPSKNHS